jgi:hypothetical protein
LAGADTVTRRQRKVSRRTQRRQAERKTRQCLFCGSEGPLTEQHVFDDWLRKLGFDAVGVRELIEVADPERRILQPGGPFTKTLKIVCEPCNGKWLSGIENSAKAVLLRLFRATGSVELDTPSQLVLARWAFKEAGMLSQLGSRKTFPLEHCRDFRRTGDPSANCQIWIGSASMTKAALGDQLVESRYEPRIAEVRIGKIVQKISAYSCRFRLLNVAFDVFGWLPTEYGLHAQLTEDLGKALLPIWPIEHPTIWWPPATSLDVLGGLQGLAAVEFTGMPGVLPKS